MADKRIETLDIFRGIAILLVVGYHFTYRLPAPALNMAAMPSPAIYLGWIGVYFFFVISGYCIFLTLERAPNVRVFLARRFSRLYPAFAAAVIGLFLVGLVLPLPSVPEAKFHEVPLSLLDVALNLVFLGELGEWVNGSFWSIAVEIKFYLLIGLLAAVLGTGPRFTRVFIGLALALVLLWIAAVAVSDIDQRITPKSLLQFVAIAPYLPFFAIGILGRKRQTGENRSVWPLGVMLAVCCVVLWLQLPTYGNTPTPLAIAGVIGSFAVLMALFMRFIGGKPLPHIPLLSPAVAAMGFLSYSWYLVHESAGFMIMGAAGPYLAPWPTAALALFGTLAVAWLFAQGFEWRFRKPFEALALAVLNRLRPLWPFGRAKTPAD